MSAEQTPRTATPAVGNVNAGTAIARYEPLEAAVAAFLDKHRNVVHDVATTAGLAAAKRDRAECRGLRISIEAARVIEKADALEYGRKVDAEAKRLTSIIAPAEDDYDQQIKAEEARKESERQARIVAERRRVADIRERIDSMKKRAANALDMTADQAEAELRELVKMEPGAGSAEPGESSFNFAEFRDEAVDAHAAAVDFLRELVDKKRRQDQDAADLAEQRRALDEKQAELDRQDRERAEALRVEQERERTEREAREKQEKAARDAEDARRREELRATEARIAEGQRKLDEQREAQEAEERRLTAERERQEAAKRDEEQRAAEAQERERNSAREAAEVKRRDEAAKAEIAERERVRAAAIRTAHCKTAADALLDISGLVDNEAYDDAQARWLIGVVCEANIAMPTVKAVEAEQAAVRG